MYFWDIHALLKKMQKILFSEIHDRHLLSGLPRQVTLSILVESGSIANGSVLEITSQNKGLTFEPSQSCEAVVNSSMGNENSTTLPFKVQTLTTHGYDDVTDTSVAMVTLPAVGPYAKIHFNLVLHASLEKQSFQEEVTEYKVCSI